MATQYFGIFVSNYKIDDLTQDGDRLVNLGDLEDHEGDLRRMVDAVSDHSRTFFAGLSDALMHRGLIPGQNGSVRIGPDWFGGVVNDGIALISSLSALEGALMLKGSVGGSKVNEDVVTLAQRAAEVRDDVTFLMEASNPRFVYFLETRGRGVFLRAAPTMSEIVRKGCWPTSATS